jgi:hypothetical protein
LASTRGEKLKPLERKSAPSRSTDETLPAVIVSLIHVPLPTELVFVRVNVHNEAPSEVEQVPAYTSISPFVDIDGIKVSKPVVLNGRVVDSVSRDRFPGDKVEEILMDAR